jgi:hypothetical protein
LNYTGVVATDIFFIIGYELLVIATWFVIVHIWAHYEGKGSFEWIIGKFKGPLFNVIVEAEHLAKVYYLLVISIPKYLNTYQNILIIKKVKAIETPEIISTI